MRSRIAIAAMTAASIAFVSTNVATAETDAAAPTVTKQTLYGPVTVAASPRGAAPGATREPNAAVGETDRVADPSKDWNVGPHIKVGTDQIPVGYTPETFEALTLEQLREKKKEAEKKFKEAQEAAAREEEIPDMHKFALAPLLFSQRIAAVEKAQKEQQFKAKQLQTTDTSDKKSGFNLAWLALIIPGILAVLGGIAALVGMAFKR